jgi:hypothetical protein
VSHAELIARMRDAFDRTGELDWSLVGDDFELHDHELPDSSVHHGREGWLEWVTNWQQAFDDYSLERVEQVEVDDGRVLTIHRLRARGRLSGVRLERTDAQLWTFSGDLLVRLDYYPNYSATERSWAPPGGEARSVI